MPAHEHLQNQLFTGQGSVDAQRRKRLLALSQRHIEDIDFAVDNKPYPKNEALEASDLKRWGPDPDPVDPANPTILRFDVGHHPHINRDYYRSDEERGSGPAEYTLPNNDRQDRVEVFGSTNFHQYRLNEIDRDEDGPLHGLAQPIYPGREYEYEDAMAHLKKSHLYMSKEEKVGARQERDKQETWSRNISEGNPELNRYEYERDQDFINNPNLVPTSEHTRRTRAERIRRLYPDGNFGRD